MSAPAEPTEPALELNAMEQRVLGSLLEKQQTVPSSYPLTFNALRTACNQTSSRDPVVDYDANGIEACVRELRHKDLVRVIHTPGQRVLKVHQRLDERLELADDERALIALLLLRGPQSPGELKTRTERLHPFADRDGVQACLTRLAQRLTPLVHELPKQAGQHDRRWLHLLGPAQPGTTAPAAPAEVVDRESVLADGPGVRDERVRRAYQEIARLLDEETAANEGDLPGAAPLDDLDTWLLNRVAHAVGDRPIVDVGCGTGRAAACLAAAGAVVTGIDAAPAMIERARSTHPRLRFEPGDLRNLMRPPAAAAWGGVVAWDCLDHFAPSELPGLIAGLARVLAPGGVLAAAVRIGTQIGYRLATPDGDLELPLVQHDRDQVLGAIASAGLRIERWYLSGPTSAPGSAHERLLVLAWRPA